MNFSELRTVFLIHPFSQIDFLVRWFQISFCYHQALVFSLYSSTNQLIVWNYDIGYRQMVEW